MADDIVDASDKAADNVERIAKSADTAVQKFAQMRDYLNQMGVANTGGGFNTMGGTVNATSGGGGGGGGFSYGSGQNVNRQSGFNSGLDTRDPSFRKEFLPGLNTTGKLGLNSMLAFGMALPSPNEAIYTELTANRLKFYTNQQTQSDAEILRLSRLGTPTQPLDAAYASNMGADIGLLPGLPNYFTNYFGGGRYGGIMGGAALASNLTPGLGIQGGMAVMGSLNQASRVNRLRMMGINVRGIGGDKMNSLPDIIQRLYEILSAAGEVTPQSIAVSAMSGNALDSLLNQYFGGDENLKQVVIAGLMQMAQTGGQSLNESGKPSALIATGGATRTSASLGIRSSRELQLFQRYQGSTTQGIREANNVLFSLYGGMMAAENVPLVTGFAELLGGAETFGGARNGAGVVLAKSLFDAGGGLVGKINNAYANRMGGLPVGPLIGAGTGMLAGAAGLGALGITDYSGPEGWLPTYRGENYKGKLIMNVYANTIDPTAVANGISTTALYALANGRS